MLGLRKQGVLFKTFLGIISMAVLLALTTEPQQWTTMMNKVNSSQEEIKNNRLHSDQKRNRLQYEKSPYLLQHADNPVDWYPWSEDAFKRAHQENKPIFLSIGYSTCHWCHVMEHESFEDQEVAQVLNESFISIKVDREERPDIDTLYMTVCQMLTNHGGWPLTIIMTPDKQPFFAATYIPKESRFGRLGMLDLLPRIITLWQTQPDKILTSAQQITTMLQTLPDQQSAAALGDSINQEAYQWYEQAFDLQHGGFGSAPKFPTPHNLYFLLRYWQRTGEAKALAIVEKTLQNMRYGGIYDHVGYGFHRYSTDKQWLVPHFEKMLYDQALLALAYLETYQATGNDFYARVAREIFSYVLRDMTSPAGGFYSAEDADSEGVEGKFYLWRLPEIQKLLTPDQASFITAVFNMDRDGNFEVEGTGRKNGQNILFMSHTFSEQAKQLQMPESEFNKKLEVIRQQLFKHREERIHPLKDDKILVDWNGLMIAALARGAQVLDEPQYAQAAAKAVDFITQVLLDSKAALLHRYRDGQASITGFLDDYTFLSWGLLELYEATFEIKYLELALNLTKSTLHRFWDTAGGGFYFTAQDAEDLLTRSKTIYDGASPSGNSVALSNLLRLTGMTGDHELEKYTPKLVQAFADSINKAPQAYTHFLSGYYLALGPTHEVVIVGNPQHDDTKLMLKSLRALFLPHKVVLLKNSADQDAAIVKLAPYTRFQTTLDNKATAYVCQHQTCNLPTTEIKSMIKMLSGEEDPLQN
ncbi:thioredoxin domain-containing protein [candidate division CSSED10-310 bacterium]|uniref:Thioredoxin domain-containing protein n=1 Tax=candidate division CSSED10-310 bacterium TaxID=2855610 RepID=A0ABV6Z0Q5_UNCC1